MTKYYGKFRGTVVKKNSKSVVVATKTGTLKTVKTSKKLKLGTQLRVNGKSVKVVGRATIPSTASAQSLP